MAQLDIKNEEQKNREKRGFLQPFDTVWQNQEVKNPHGDTHGNKIGETRRAF